MFFFFCFVFFCSGAKYILLKGYIIFEDDFVRKFIVEDVYYFWGASVSILVVEYVYFCSGALVSILVVEDVYYLWWSFG